jgi:glycosyltransferase involved in cell wall biosynthesis
MSEYCAIAPDVEAPAERSAVIPESRAVLQGKRTAMVTFSSYPADPRPRRAAEALLDQGMSIDLICLADGNAPKREVSGGINVLRLSITHRRGSKLTYLYNYSAFISISASILAARSLKRRYDLVYVHNMPDILVVSSLVPKALGAKVLLDLHDPMPELMTTIFNLETKSRSVRLIQRLEKWSIARADSVVTVNQACAKLFASRSCPSPKVTVIMNSPDERIFGFRPAHARTAPGECPDGPFVLMYHGSLVERNGLDLAIDALAQVRRSVPNAELRIYGRSTPFLNRMLEEVDKRGLQQAVRYLGPKSLEQLVPAIEACDVGVIPNHRSVFTELNTPTRIFEYLALGKPVIAPRAPGICDYFEHDSLVFFELGDANDLARRIEYVFSHPAEVADTVRRGQQVQQQHSWPIERFRLIGLVASLLSTR